MTWLPSIIAVTAGVIVFSLQCYKVSLVQKHANPLADDPSGGSFDEDQAAYNGAHATQYVVVGAATGSVLTLAGTAWWGAAMTVLALSIMAASLPSPTGPPIMRKQK